MPDFDRIARELTRDARDVRHGYSLDGATERIRAALIAIYNEGRNDGLEEAASSVARLQLTIGDGPPIDGVYAFAAEVVRAKKVVPLPAPTG